MAFTWHVDPPVAEADLASVGADRAFADQLAAEEWLTTNYLELDALGVRHVALYEEGRLIYGPMSLES